MSLALSQKAVADALGVCVRTVRHWDAGRNRVPWSAVRLLRLLRGGDLGELSPAWTGWRLSGDRLVTPAGVVFRGGEFSWWALTCLQARSWQRSFDRSRATRLSAGEDSRPAVPVVDGGVFSVEDCPAAGYGQSLDPAAERASHLLTALASGPLSDEVLAPRSGAGTSGLVSNTTSGTQQGGCEAECGLQGIDVGPQWGHNGATIPTVSPDDRSQEVEPAPAPGSARVPARPGGARVHERECRSHRGGAELDRVPEQTATSPGRPSGHDPHGNKGVAGQPDEERPGDYCTDEAPCDWDASECPFLGCPRREGRCESALPVRQRPKVQALPRQGLKVPSPASLAASGDGGCSHNRAQSAQGKYA